MLNKKSIITCCLSLTPLLSHTASADGGAISITGQIAETACVFASSDMNIAFGDITTVAGKVAAGSDLADSKIGAVNLTKCPASSFIAGIDGEADDNNPDLYKIPEGDGQASGIAYRLWITGATAAGGLELMKPGSTSGTRFFTTAYMQSFGFYAQPVSTLAQITPGTINASYTYTVTYQ